MLTRRTGETMTTLADEFRRIAEKCGIALNGLRTNVGLDVPLDGAVDPLTWDPERGSGRTTRILLRALLAVEAGERVVFQARTLDQARDLLYRPALAAAARGGLDARNIMLPGRDLRGLHGVIVYRDHSYDPAGRRIP